MPVFSCGGNRWKIGQNGKCIYKSKAAAEAAFKGFLATKREEEKTMQEEPKLNKKELRAMLDAQIRRDAGWKLKDSYSSLGVLAADDEAVMNAANGVYDDIVGRFEYSENTVKATRSVRFNKAYVRRVIKAGLKDGSIKTEALVAKIDIKVRESLDEAIPAFILKKIKDKKKKGKKGDKGKDGKKDKFPFNLKKKAKK